MDCRDSQNYDCRNNMYTIIPNLSFLIQKQTFLCKKSFDTVSDWIDYYNMTLKYTLFTAKLPRKMINVLQNLGCSLPNWQRDFLLYFDYFTYLQRRNCLNLMSSKTRVAVYWQFPTILLNFWLLYFIYRVGELFTLEVKPLGSVLVGVW